jgi:hypothetical protein
MQALHHLHGHTHHFRFTGLYQEISWYTGLINMVVEWFLLVVCR